MESEKYSWIWVTKNTLLSTSACELISAHLVPDAAGTSTAIIYNGQNTHGEIIISFRGNGGYHTPFQPPVPVYCRGGLYVVITSNVRGILVQWRNKPEEEN